jgi:hypothetical protein
LGFFKRMKADRYSVLGIWQVLGRMEGRILPPSYHGVK